jgi:excisionase family DNA binding protein
MHNNLMSVDELAEKLSVPKSWLYQRTRLTGPGAIPCVRLGKYVRFDWEKVKEWIERQNAE